MNNTFTNTLLVIVLVLIVGFGVWYVTMRSQPEPSQGGAGIEVRLNGEDNPGDNSGSGR